MIVLVAVAAVAAALLTWLFFLPLRWRWPLPAGDHLPTLAERAPLPPPYPDGWIPLLAAHELARGQVRQIRALGKLFAVYRGASGTAAVTEAFCPHLGANLAEPRLGAAVAGDCLRCPFHGWEFDAIARDGACVHIPYTDKLPTRSARARLGVFPSREADGLIWVWHDAAGRAPTWELPEPQRPGRLDAFWQLELAAAAQDLMENQSDVGHAGVVHARLAPGLHFHVDPREVEIAPGERLGLDWDRRASWPSPPRPRTGAGWRAWVRAGARPGDGPPLRDGLPADGARHPQEMTVAHIGALAFAGGLATVSAFLVIRELGPCMFRIAVAVWLGGRWRWLPATMRMAATPVAPGHLTVRVTVCSEGTPRWLSKAILVLFWLIGRQDFRIWGSKSWRARPPFVEGDGRIPAFRKWYSQFSPEGVEPAAPRAEDGEAPHARVQA